MAEREGFEKAVSGADAVIDDPDVRVVVIATPHNSHATLVAQALRTGKNVFCEKPLALTCGELDDVEAAQREGGGVLFVGFNRRYSEAIRMVTAHFASGTAPLVITYRVNAGTVPAKHWYHDRRQGGRLVGEMCHFIDTCAAIVSADVVDVHAIASGRAERLLDEDLVVSLRFGDGSLATISYASGGHATAEKERIEVLGRGRSATVTDLRRLWLDGRERRLASTGKGHLAEVKAFRAAIATERDIAVDRGLRSSRAALLAAGALVRR
jgi:predicted dehydrogenase